MYIKCMEVTNMITDQTFWTIVSYVIVGSIFAIGFWTMYHQGKQMAEEKTLVEIHGEVLRKRQEDRDREYPRIDPDEAERQIEDLQGAIIFALERLRHLVPISGVERENLQDACGRLLGALPFELREQYQ